MDHYGVLLWLWCLIHHYTADIPHNIVSGDFVFPDGALMDGRHARMGVGTLVQISVPSSNPLRECGRIT